MNTTSTFIFQEHSRFRMKRLTPFLLSLFVLTDISNSCRSTLKIGSLYTIQVSIRHTYNDPLEVVLLKDTSPVSVCRQNLVCNDYRNNTETKIHSLGNDTFEIHFSIKNVTRRDAGLLSVKYLGLSSLRNSGSLYRCKMIVYDIDALTLDECPNVVEEGSEVKCLCKKKDGVTQDIRLAWFDNNGKVNNKENHTLYYVANATNLTFTCQGWANDGAKSRPLIYQPVLNLRIVNAPPAYSKVTSEKSHFSISFIVTLVVVSVSFIAIVMYACYQKKNRKLCLKFKNKFVQILIQKKKTFSKKNINPKNVYIVNLLETTRPNKLTTTTKGSNSYHLVGSRDASKI
ncbi:uncharacterized protein LOC106078200 isoform X2 [Biomphalaria glabrata]|nr:uncharacterized protein LOC106078200 isoform X2 [Biomphalaria glabrata]XP_055866713.1 uncharacterized protein LOC106078200 isoform X2 [Biomphalaria glabrata]XP_055866714.1 uncharacterized protein LOC106078200 isoform X2 [Biomphalaria glabrata]XP_055866715.1 uncharacterized protein LOC106078200 isoform X2 [Biomphalaria glabrata]